MFQINTTLVFIVLLHPCSHEKNIFFLHIIIVLGIMHMLDEIYAEFYYLEKGKQIMVLISFKE